MPGSRSGYFFFAQKWIHEDEVHRQCRVSMNTLDCLSSIVRTAVHESDFYTEPETARILVRRYGAKAAAHLIRTGPHMHTPPGVLTAGRLLGRLYAAASALRTWISELH